MNRSTLSLHRDYQRVDIILYINQLLLDRGITIDNFIGETNELIHFNYTQLKEKFVILEKQNELVENEFIFIKDTDDFVVRMKQIITRNLHEPDEKKMIAAHNLDLFLTTHSCFIPFDVEQVVSKGLFSKYRGNKELQDSARMIHLDCLFTRFEAHFKERYKEFECKNKSGDSKNCILCTQNWYII